MIGRWEKTITKTVSRIYDRARGFEAALEFFSNELQNDFSTAKITKMDDDMIHVIIKTLDQADWDLGVFPPIIFADDMERILCNYAYCHDVEKWNLDKD